MERKKHRSVIKWLAAALCMVMWGIWWQPVRAQESEGMEDSLEIQETEDFISEETEDFRTKEDVAMERATNMARQSGWFYDYWMCYSWDDLMIGLRDHGAVKFVLLQDIEVPWTLQISTGMTVTIHGNGHQMINTKSDPGPMIEVVNGGVLVTEGNLILNGNCHRTDGGLLEGGSSAVDCVNATWYGSDTVICNNWNYGYIGSGDLGGGTGFNVLSSNGSGYPAVGVFSRCSAYNCDGAGFYVKNADGNGASLYAKDCCAYDVSWGFMAQNAYMELQKSQADANRCDMGKFCYGGGGIVYQGNGTGSVDDCDVSGIYCGVWTAGNRRITIRNSRISKSSIGIFSAGAGETFWAKNCTIFQNDVGIKNGFYDTPAGYVVTCQIRENTTGVENSGRLSLYECKICRNGNGVSNYASLCVSKTKAEENRECGIANQVGTLWLCSDFDASCYRSLYPDLQQAYGTDEEALFYHFLRYGMQEGRSGALVSGNEISQNGIGIVNWGSMYHRGAKCGANVSYDIEQRGSYVMGRGSRITGNGIWMQNGCILQLESPLDCEEHSIGITLEENFPKRGQTVVRCVYEQSWENGDSMKEKFSLKNTCTQSLMEDGITHRKAVLRGGNGTNGTLGDVVVSEVYRIAYRGNLDNPHVTFSSLEDEEIYWWEDQEIVMKKGSVLYDGIPLAALVQTDWCLLPEGGSVFSKAGEKKRFAWEECDRDYVLYAVYQAGADVIICGNGQTSGEDYTLSVAPGEELLLPENSFEKVNKQQVWNVNFEEMMWDVTEYAHVGWSKRADACYRDADVMAEGSRLDVTAWVMECLRTDQVYVNTAGGIEGLQIYCVWDESPKITASNCILSKEEVAEGKVTEKELLRTAEVSDREDQKNVYCHVCVPMEETLLSLGTKGYVTVRYEATDGAGNKTSALIRVWVTETGFYQSAANKENPLLLRHIDAENYEKDSVKSGGLMRASVWYEDEEAKKILTDAFARQIEKEPKSHYEFTR